MFTSLLSFLVLFLVLLLLCLSLFLLSLLVLLSSLSLWLVLGFLFGVVVFFSLSVVQGKKKGREGLPLASSLVLLWCVVIPLLRLVL